MRPSKTKLARLLHEGNSVEFNRLVRRWLKRHGKHFINLRDVYVSNLTLVGFDMTRFDVAGMNMECSVFVNCTVRRWRNIYRAKIYLGTIFQSCDIGSREKIKLFDMGAARDNSDATE